MKLQVYPTIGKDEEFMGTGENLLKILKELEDYVGGVMQGDAYYADNNARTEDVAEECNISSNFFMREWELLKSVIAIEKQRLEWAAGKEEPTWDEDEQVRRNCSPTAATA